MSRQSKRAAFAFKARNRRRADRVRRDNQHRPGFIGVVTNLTVTTVDGRTMRQGIGALFLGEKS